MLGAYRNRSKDTIQHFYDQLGLESAQSVIVNHTCLCFGIVIKHRDGWSIA